MPQYPAVIALASLDGADGFQLSGEAAYDYAGQQVSSAGDLNGDGFDDVIVSAKWADPHGAYSGASYVVFGRAGGFAATIPLSSLDGNNGFQLSGEAAMDNAGRTVAAAGDVNGDGIDDIIVGAIGLDTGAPNAGGAYVVFGRKGSFSPVLELSSLTGSNGFQINSADAGFYSGWSVSGAGDVNGDGFDDVIVGTLSQSVSYVVFGKAGDFAANFNLAALDGTNGFRIAGAAGETAGNAVSVLGDVNGDGFDDLLVGAGEASGGGAAYVVFGHGGAFAPIVSLAALDGATGFRMTGAASGDAAGYSVSRAGDVNGDGLADLIVGARLADAGALDSGAAYVVFGKAGGFAPQLALGALDGVNGFRIAGAGIGDLAGESVAAAGDFNGDGFDDLIVGARFADDRGAAYVVFGRAAGFAPSVNLLSLNGDNGVRLDGEFPRTGLGVGGAGDVNGDGFADVIVGAGHGSISGMYTGAAYVVFGRAPDDEVVRVGSVIGQRIFGGAFDDGLSGRGGDDTLEAGGGDDELLGGSGADSLLAGSGDDLVEGGGGGDRLDGSGGDDRLYGGSGNDRLLGGTGNDMLDGGSGLDRADYDSATAAVTVNLSTLGWQNTGRGGYDNFWNVEGVIGSRFDDRLTGGVFDEDLIGGLGNDTLTGGDGADTLTGGRGGDRLVGGAGADRFVFAAVDESQGTGAGADRIVGLAAGDLIDLSAIDADTTARGNQSFVIQSGFSGLPRQLTLTYQSGPNQTVVNGDVNGDSVADFTLILDGGDYRTFSGFVL